MSTTFRPYVPDQSLLLPPDVREWLPEGHLAHHVSDLVDGLDLTAFYALYEGDGRRNAPYEPRMMVKVLLYAYATGVFSSRRVARKLEEDVGFRVLAAGNFPQHRTLCEFRRRHLEDFQALFVEVVRLAQELGLARFLHPTGRLQSYGSDCQKEANEREVLHRSPEPSPVRSGRCCLRGCQSLPLVQRSPADERERTRTGTAPAAPGFGTQAPARTSRPTQPERGCWSGRGHQRCRVLGAARARKPRRNDLRHDAGCGSGLRAARSRRLASARCRAEPAAGALLGRDAPPRDHRDRLAGTTAYALEATVVLDIIHVAAATRRAVLVVGSSKGLSAFGPRPDGSRPAHGDTWLQLRRFSAAAGSRSLDAY